MERVCQYCGQTPCDESRSARLNTNEPAEQLLGCGLGCRKTSDATRGGFGNQSHRQIKGYYTVIDRSV